MSTRIGVVASVVIALLMAQDVVGQAADGGVPVDNCVATHLADKCKPAPGSAEENMRRATVQGRRLEFKKSLSLPEQSPVHDSSRCEARFTIAYAQMNDQIRVKTEVKNDSCVKSRGEYTLRVRSINEAGEVQTRTIPASWSRQEEGPVKLTEFYSMEGDVDLVWVKVKSNRKTACTCDEP